MRSLLVLSVLAVSAAGFATTTFYTSEAAWLAAVSGPTSYDFEGIAAPAGFVGYGTGPLSVGPGTFTTNDNTLFVIDKAYGGTGYFNGLYSCLSAQGSVSNVHVNLGSGFHAFGMVYDNWGGQNTVLTLDNNASGQGIGGGFGTENFLGFVSDDVVADLDISVVPGDVFNMTRFSTAAVPEPATMAVLGLAVLAKVRRRKVSR